VRIVLSEAKVLRVLHLQDHSLPHYSGYSFRSRYIVRNLHRRGVDVRVVTSARHDDFEEMEEQVDGLRYFRTKRPDGFLDRLQLAIPFWRERIMTRAMVDRLREVAIEFKPDLIHAHSPFFNGQAAIRVGKELGIPVVYEIRAFWEDDAVDKKKIAEDGFVYRQVRRLETEVVQSASHVVCICQGLLDDLVERGVSKDKISIVKNGVEAQTFEPQAKDGALEAELGLQGKRVLGFIGSFFYYEGLPFLVDAIAKVRSQRDDFAVLLTGAGEDEEHVAARVVHHGLEDCVRLTGRVSHDVIQKYYALIDIFCYPRHSKRLTEKVTPLKPLEAMAMEQVCIGSDVGGIRELFDECEVGRTFKAGDIDDLVRLIHESLDRGDGDLAEEGRVGRNAVLTKRHWENTLEPTLEAYQSLVGSPALKTNKAIVA
jgi:glycogen(starch) synthase